MIASSGQWSVEDVNNEIYEVELLEIPSRSGVYRDIREDTTQLKFNSKSLSYSKSDAVRQIRSVFFQDLENSVN